MSLSSETGKPAFQTVPVNSGNRVRNVAIWLLVSSLLIGSHFNFYFLKPHYEGGDFAANALQIRQAKVFHELYGNYSRFGFHHPGPAFFYAYALGEVVLFDALKIVPAPYNAHAITGILIQAFFFTWTLAIIGRRVRRPLLIPLLLVFAGVHFGLVNFNFPDSAFQSIWPPYVLLFPFLCFLIAAASVASGEVKDLVPCVLAGCMLVHGHVAQPLLVVPLFALAYATLCFSRSSESGRRFLRPLHAAPYTHLCAVGIVLVFLLPIVLDICRGEESNLRLVLRHFSQHAHEHKSLAQSLTYFMAFLCYLGKPETYCDPLTFSSLRFLTERWYFLPMWALIALITVISLKRMRNGERDFVRWLSICFAVAVFLTIVWGKLQNAEMFAFNAHFNFALLFLPFILAAISLVFFHPLRPVNWLRPILYFAAFALGTEAATNWHGDLTPPTAPSGTEPMVETIWQAALKDPPKQRTKFLLFEHDNWDWAAGVALALERYGFDYAVPRQWSFIFGNKHVAGLPSSLKRGDVALWTVKSPAVAGENWISNSVPQIDPAQAEITFSGAEANAQAFVIEGWDVSTGSFSWSTQKTALLYFRASPASHDVQIDFEVFPYNFSTNRVQRVSISFNNEPPESFDVTQRSILSTRLPATLWNRSHYAMLSFEFPDAISPREVGESTDGRLLGCGFIRIDFHPVRTATNAPPE
jgi:hypothetical protein